MNKSYANKSNPKRYGSKSRPNYNRRNYQTKRVDNGSKRANNGKPVPNSNGSLPDSVTRQIDAIKRSNLSKSQKNKRIKQVLENQRYQIGQTTEQVRAKGHAYSQTIASTGASVTPALVSNSKAVPAIQSANSLIKGSESGENNKDENTTDQSYGDPR